MSLPGSTGTRIVMGAALLLGSFALYSFGEFMGSSVKNAEADEEQRRAVSPVHNSEGDRPLVEQFRSSRIAEARWDSRSQEEVQEQDEGWEQGQEEQEAQDEQGEQQEAFASQSANQGYDDGNEGAEEESTGFSTGSTGVQSNSGSNGESSDTSNQELDADTSETSSEQQEAQSDSSQPSTGNPFAGAQLYVADSPARQHAENLRSSDPHAAAMLDMIAGQPTAQWFGGWNADVRNDARQLVSAAESAGAIAVLIAYNIPQRDCGQYSAGGSSGADAYRSWIRSLAEGIGSGRAAVILEPDALAGMDCLSSSDQETRVSLLREAVDILNAQGNVSVYLDAGNPTWIGAQEMAERLRRAGVDRARGFALNVSNYFTTQDNIPYGEAVSSVIGKPFVIDTSRNGAGPTSDNEWCNPPGRALGSAPITNTGNDLIDALLWLKVPGESDGTCNGGPSAGTFWVEYAIGLAERASW